MKTHGVDLDKTMATYDEWKGPEHIGAPIPVMVARVEKWLKDGDKVDVFTARMHPSNKGETKKSEVAVREWFKDVFGKEPREVTCMKDPRWDDIWDDSVTEIVPNTGERVDGVEDVEVKAAADSIGDFLA